MGSAFKYKGVQPLLDAIIDILPAPEQRPPIEATLFRRSGGLPSKHAKMKSKRGGQRAGKSGAVVSASEAGAGEDAPGSSAEDVVRRARSKDEKMVALAFKVVHDKHMGDLVFLRVYSGVLHAKASLLNTSQAGRPLTARSAPPGLNPKP